MIIRISDTNELADNRGRKGQVIILNAGKTEKSNLISSIYASFRWHNAIIATLMVVVCASMIAIGAAPAHAFDTVTSFGPSDGKVEGKHFSIQPQSQFFYSQEYSFTGWLEDGGEFGAEFLISNVGIGGIKGGVNAWYRPGNGGKKLKASLQKKKGQWSWQNSPAPGMKVGGSSFTAEPGKATIAISEGELQAEAQFINILPPWRPGSGRVHFGSARKDYYDVTLLAPKAQVKGKVLIDGEWKEFTGYGYADHKATTVAPQEQAKTWIRFRAYEGDWTIISQEFILPSSLGGGRIPWIIIGYKDRLVFQSLTHTLTPQNIVEDKKFSYIYPMGLDFAGKEGDRTLAGKVTATRLTDRADLLSGLGAIERAVVSRFSKPVGYYMDADYLFNLTIAGKPYQIKGKGSYYVKHLNP